MADPEPSATPEPNDEAAYAASGLRSTARWAAGAFAGIPSLAVIASLIRAPGDAGFHDGYLIAGVMLAALGAVAGIWAFAKVLEPVGLTDADISPEVIKLLPASRVESYTELRRELEAMRDEVGNERVLASDEAGRAEVAEARATAAETTVSRLEELLKNQPQPDPVKVEEAKVARAVARDLRARSGEAEGRSAVSSKQLELDEQILDSLEALRRQAYGLQAGATVRHRYSASYESVLIAAVLVATGVIALALAPKPTPEEAGAAASAPELVTLEPTGAGRDVLGCEEDEVPALKVGGDKKTPTVIVLPGGPCPVQTIKWATADPTPLGKADPVEVVEPE